MQPVSMAALRISALSSGLMVWMSSTRALIPSPASCSAAASAICTVRPVAAMVTSLPSRRVTPLPSSKE